MAILYRTAKFKSANTFEMVIWDPTAKFNSSQYFRLYGIYSHTHTGKCASGDTYLDSYGQF